MEISFFLYLTKTRLTVAGTRPGCKETASAALQEVSVSCGSKLLAPGQEMCAHCSITGEAFLHNEKAQHKNLCFLIKEQRADNTVYGLNQAVW